MSIFSMRQYLASGKPRMLVKPTGNLIEWEVWELSDTRAVGTCRTFEEISAVQTENQVPVVFVDDAERPQEVAEAAAHYGWYTFRGQDLTGEDYRAQLANEVPLVRPGFVQAMEAELQENKIKGDWCEFAPTLPKIEGELAYHQRKLVAALRRVGDMQLETPGARCARVRESAADLANFCMKADEIYGAAQEI